MRLFGRPVASLKFGDADVGPKMNASCLGLILQVPSKTWYDIRCDEPVVLRISGMRDRLRIDDLNRVWVADLGDPPLPSTHSDFAHCAFGSKFVRLHEQQFEVLRLLPQLVIKLACSEYRNALNLTN